MAALTRRWAADLMHVWFHRLGPEDWFGGSAALDDLLRRRFEELLKTMSARPIAEFLDGPRVALASVLLFDQLPRNLYRDDPAAYGFDPKARAICHAALDRNWHQALVPAERQFLGMPLMHSERIADQRRSLGYFRRFADRSAFAFARSHHRMIARFGRFPHRNAVLGRTSTSAEKAAIAAGYAW